MPWMSKGFFFPLFQIIKSSKVLIKYVFSFAAQSWFSQILSMISTYQVWIISGKFLHHLSSESGQQSWLHATVCQVTLALNPILSSVIIPGTYSLLGSTSSSVWQILFTYWEFFFSSVNSLFKFSLSLVSLFPNIYYFNVWFHRICCFGICFTLF
jgi:hypothetical protein